MRHSPAEASFYYCERIAPNGSPVRFPTDRALNLNPFEWPAGAKAGTWLIRYCRDAQGRVVIPNTHGKVQVVATLTYPAEVYDQPEGASDDVLMQVLEEKAEEAEDDEEGSLKATRIDAKKREIAIDLTAKEQKLVRRAAVNKELAEGYLLNRAHRMEVRDQSEAMFRVQNQTLVMSERNLVLIEKIQESLGRVAELEKEASRKVATPPAPIDYSPVLNSVVGAIRDIGVSALQRDHRLRPRSEEEATPVKAALADKPAASPVEVSASADKPPAAIATGTPAATPALPAAEQPTMANLLAEMERMRAERDRLKSELEAERQRQLVLAEITPPAPAPEAAKVTVPASPPQSSPPLAPPSQPPLSSPPPESARVPEPTQTTEPPAPQTPPTPPPAPAAASRQPAEPIQAAPPMEQPSATEVPQPPRPAPTEQPLAMGSPESAPPLPSAKAAEPTATLRTPTPASTAPQPAIPPQTLADASKALPAPASASASTKLAAPLPPTRKAAAPIVEDTLDIPAAQQSSPLNGSPFTPRAPRNAPCPCGSTRKYKKCCLAHDQRVAQASASTGRAAAQPAAASAHTAPGNGVKNGAATVASDATPSAAPLAATAASAISEPPSTPPDSMPGMPSLAVQEVLVNSLAGKLLADPDKPVPPPLVTQVELVEEVLVAPPKMDPETARKLMNDGSTLEAFGAFLFFNPMLRTALLSRRGK